MLAFLYVAMVVFGAVTTRWYHSRHKKDASSEEMDLVAGRKLGGIIGIFTLAGYMQFCIFIFLDRVMRIMAICSIFTILRCSSIWPFGRRKFIPGMNIMGSGRLRLFP